jgi:hypothetical protein
MDPIETDVNGPHTVDRDRSKTAAAIALIAAMLDTVASEPSGAPSGPMYVCWMSQGGSLDGYQTFMSNLVDARLLRHSGHVYHITPAGQSFLKGLNGERV